MQLAELAAILVNEILFCYWHCSSKGTFSCPDETECGFVRQNTLSRL